MEFAFPTERLRVFEGTVIPWPDSGPRLVYLAFMKPSGAPQTVAHAIVWDLRALQEPIFRLYCDWMEVAPHEREKGYATELFRGIEKHLEAEMQGVAVSKEGEALLRSLGKPTDAFERAMQPLREFLSRIEQSTQGNAAATALTTGLKQLLEDTSKPAYQRYRALTQLMSNT
jgi:hypothetical protein